ncbi:MAG: hypothetical protein AAF665_05840 [Pseudomonadota bacterium]
MIFSAASKLITRLSDGDKTKGIDSENLLKKSLGLSTAGIPIGREDEPVGYVRWKAQDNDAVHAGSLAKTDSERLEWREYVWGGPTSIDECDWGQVRWRFYSNGLVCFDAQMSNTSGKLDFGDIQGHRIELREENGLLLGVWIAGFFVRRSLPLRGFAASFVDEHAPLRLHFSEIKDVHKGAWICL